MKYYITRIIAKQLRLIALAIKAGRHVILLNEREESKQFFQKIGGEFVI